MKNNFRNGAESDTENELRLRAETGSPTFSALEGRAFGKMLKTSIDGLLVRTS